MNSTTHTMRLQSPHYEKIINGTKSLELRLADEKRMRVKPGDIIEFSDGNSSVRTKVDTIYKGSSFKELFNTELSVEDAGFESIELLIQETRKYYSEEDEKKLGVIVFRISLI